MKEKNTRTKKMTQKIMIFLAVMICVGMISAVTTTAVTNDKTPTTTNQAENKSNVTKTTVNKKNTDLNNKETVNKNNTDSNNKTIKAYNLEKNGEYTEKEYTYNLDRVVEINIRWITGRLDGHYRKFKINYDNEEIKIIEIDKNGEKQVYPEK